MIKITEYDIHHDYMDKSRKINEIFELGTTWINEKEIFLIREKIHENGFSNVHLKEKIIIVDDADLKKIIKKVGPQK